MFLFANEMPITLEALDANGGVLSDMAASLRHLDGERAVVALSARTPAPSLHWGTRVRFQIADGTQRYSVIGTVIAHDLPASRKAADSPEIQEALECEATLQLWECRSADQQRVSPRRHVHFDVHFRVLDQESTATETPQPDVWEQGTCVDIGGGGLCMRIPHRSTYPKRVEVRFTLPTTQSEKIPGPEFTLRGRVLRTTTHALGQEVALRFERLSVAQGMALATYLF